MLDHHQSSRREEFGEVSARLTLAAVVAWFVDARLDQDHGPKAVPFYCDQNRIGAFAVNPEELAVGREPTLFQLFVTLSMYQALRDVVIMQQQRSLPRNMMRVVADADLVKESIAHHACPALGSAHAFEESCDVSKFGKVIDCGVCPGANCQVKDATMVFNRMGDLGKLPTSAWLRIWKEGGLHQLLVEVCRETISPTERAMLLVDRFMQVHRVGRKLATMFVSALSTPILYPGFTPWFPRIDGNELMVIDTNVARGIDLLRAPNDSKTYSSRESWLREQAASIDLRGFRPGLPSYSPRLVQQALYAFCSKSNRVASQDPCAKTPLSCDRCAPRLCPFVEASSG
ncbi:MAG: hypothetical protein HQL56_05180 [Magnetococcales bacterium]|nr:hypothetical protein [Magnetococcales bacterium]